MENKNSNVKKIIIVTSVIIIIFSLIICGIFLGLNKNKKKPNVTISENKVSEEDIIQEENDRILEQENIKIKDDQNEILNRKYGKVEIVWVDEENNIIDEPLIPCLGGMTKLSYNSKKTAFEEVKDEETEWYNYKEQEWANAIDENGSYFVWIPRYAYRIVYYSDSQYSKVIGYTDARGILKLNVDGSFTRIATNNAGIRQTDNHYIVAPAFVKDVASGYRNGGWSKELAGIWVAKYEMSMEKDKENIVTSSSEIGNVSTSDTIKAVSKPGATSWRNININNCYLNSFNYARNRDSHLMKNSEWGAVAYLAYSKYGIGAIPLEINKNSDYRTGGSNIEKSVYLSNASQSSAGNATGVYDLSGGAWEYIAAYIDNGYEGLKTNGGGSDKDIYGSRNSKYKTVYENDDIDKAQNYSQEYSNKHYALTLKRRGDAIYESSNSGYGNDAWNLNASFFPQNDIPFFIRGGDYRGASGMGLFSFNGYSGSSNNSEGFRVVLAF